jgi:hypothetical protein
MRIDFEDLQLYTNINHQVFENFIRDCYLKNTDYSDMVTNDTWFYKSSPYHIFEIALARDAGIYEIIYDYIKRRVLRGKTVFDFGAGIGTLEVLLLKRFPAALTVEEANLLCLDFIYWRLHRRNASPAPLLKHYDYVVSIDMLQTLAPEQIEPTLRWLLLLGDRCFIQVPEDPRHPHYNPMPFDLETYLRANADSVNYYHGLWDIEVKKHEDSHPE